ncbi:MAG TPA: type II toxin-antitoxin system Phd/YefM family antitoxin [Thermoanaerobaculia bacterium]|nr:type II toxin-antitoxin system Phd/YefM family antitoxin [Thermoanaerobaculia bacterium]
MKTIKASEFKARCLQLMDEVRDTGEPLLITKNGEPVSKLVPVHERAKSLFGLMKESVTISGDILSPVDVEWDAEK